jgi:uncharacterized protein (TIGR02265 family)
VSEHYGGFEGALRHLGRLAARDFLKSPMGRMLLLVTANSPKPLAASLPVTYPTGWQHGTGAVRWRNFRQCVVLIQGNVVPHPYFEGVLGEVFAATKAVNVSVHGRQVGPADTEYDLSWDTVPCKELGRAGG